jgi:hypothetical protein
MHAPLALYDNARAALDACRRVDEVKVIHDKAKALEVYARQARDTQLMGYAVEIRLRAERRAGELLKRMTKARGGQVNGRPKKIDGSREKPSIRPTTLRELNITKTQSSRWQRLASISSSQFEVYLADAKQKQQQAMSDAQRNAARTKHYWITPPDIMTKLQSEFRFTLDACPHPRPRGFDGLKSTWGKSTYCNPIFGNGNGATAWAHKTISEHKKGKMVVMVWPIDGWVLAMIEAGAEIRNLGHVKWCSIEDGEAGTGSARPIAAFILRGKPRR